MTNRWLATARQFDGSKCIRTASVELAPGIHEVRLGDCMLQADFRTRECAGAGAPDALDGEILWTVLRGELAEASLAFEIDFPAWSRQNYVLFPAAVYAGNRFRVRELGHKYPPMYVDPDDRTLDRPITITDVPHLESGDGRIQLKTGDMATPCIGIFCPHEKHGMLLLTTQETRLGQYALHIRETGPAARITLEAPGVRTDGMYSMMNSRHPTIDRGARLAAGDTLLMRFRLIRFPAHRVQDLFDRFAAARKDLFPDDRGRNEIPFSAAWQIQEAKYNAQNWSADGYYTVGTDSSKFGQWQLGWVGGGMNSVPLLLAGTSQSQSRARATLDWMFTRAQRPGGLLVGIIADGKDHGDGFDAPGTQQWVMTRKLADGLYFAMKHLVLLRCRGEVVPPAWITGTRNLADALLRIWNRYGQLGQFVDYDTGEIAVGGSTAAAMAPGALALAGQFFDHPAYLSAAAAVAEHLYQRDIVRGLTTGGPGEILDCPDSESAFAMLESFVVLFEVTADPTWLTRAGEMARQACTWVHSYNYRFPPDSPFGQLDLRTLGSVWANAQNKHSAPGICTLSGDSLLKLYRATGDWWYLDLCRDIVHGTVQYLSREDRPVQMLKPGWMCERVNTCDWEYTWCSPGHVFNGSCWCEVSSMLSFVEVPGIYVDLESLRAIAIDHVEARVLDRTAAGVQLQVTNPTKFPAQVRVLVETAAARRLPLGQAASLAWPTISIPAGQTAQFTL